MIVVNKEKVKKLLRRGLAFSLVIGLAAGYRVMNPGPGGVQPTGTSGEVTNWGLSFQEEGTAPTGNGTKEELAQYDAWYVGDTGKKTIYLTFDAGYENGYTADILDTLKKHKVPAAFFLVGTYIQENPDLVKRMAKEGHIVGNHSMHHKDMTTVTDEKAFAAELGEAEQAYQSAIGDGKDKATMPKYYRPPEGRFSIENLKMAQKLGYKTIFWSLAYVDWNTDQQPTREEALQTLLPRTHKGAVILLHSTSKTNAKVLGELIERWKAEGYQFGTLDELTTGS